MKEKSKTYTLENYSDEKFGDLLGFYEGMGRGEGGLSEKEARWWRVKLCRPQYNPGKNLFLLSDAKCVIAFLDLVNESRIGRVVMHCQVRPGYLFADAATELLIPCLERCAEWKGERIHICLNESNHAAQRFFRASGFTPVRTFLELNTDLKENSESEGDPEPGRYSFFCSGEEEHLQKLQNEIFKRNWGFCPNTVEEIEYYLALTGISVEDVLLLKEGDEVIGYCWAHESPESADTMRAARIYMLGVLERFRGKDLGRKLLGLSLAVLKSHGFRTVELTVDAENAPACSLYAKLGFRVRSRSLWFEKTLSLSGSK